MGIFGKKKDKEQKKPERVDIDFATISTGGKPDVEIHAAGYTSRNRTGIDAATKLMGTTRNIVTLADGIVSGVVKNAEKTWKRFGAAAAIEVLMMAMQRACPSGYALAMSHMKHEEALEINLGEEDEKEILELLKGVLKKELEEEEEA